MNNRNKDIIVGGLFLSLTIFFIMISMTNKPFFDWVFERHHNQWSWYLRPLFLLPFCYLCLHKKFHGNDDVYIRCIYEYVLVS